MKTQATILNRIAVDKKEALAKLRSENLAKQIKYQEIAEKTKHIELLPKEIQRYHPSKPKISSFQHPDLFVSDKV